jgi:hypothetical protein
MPYVSWDYRRREKVDAEDRESWVLGQDQRSYIRQASKRIIGESSPGGNQGGSGRSDNQVIDMQPAQSGSYLPGWTVK